MFHTLLCLVLACSAASESEPLFNAEFIFPPEKERHFHASCIVQCPDGSLLAVWYENGDKLADPPYYSKRQDKSDDVRIAGARKPAGESKWQAPFVVSDTFGTSDNNPALVIDAEKRLWLFHSTMLGAPEWSWSSSLLQYKVSADYLRPGCPRWDKTGLLFPATEKIPGVLDQLQQRIERGDAPFEGLNKVRATVLLERMRLLVKDRMHRRLGWMPRVHPLVRSDGTLVVPLSNENFEIPMMAMTRDGGETWTYSDPVPDVGLIQPSLVEFPDGTMTAYFRTGDPRHRVKQSFSSDKGLTWSPPVLTDLPHPGGGIEAVRLQNGHVAMVYNNKEQTPRDKLAVSISTDQGKSWRWTRQLEDSPGERFDYPSIVQGDDGTLHVTYSHNLTTIKHVQLNEAWIQAGE